MKLLRHLTGYLPVNIASGLASFGGVYVFTRLLGDAEYGRYALMVWAVAMIHTLSLTWVEAANYRFTGTAIESGRLTDHYRTALRLMVRSLAVALLLLAAMWGAFHLFGIAGYDAILPWLAGLLIVDTIVKMALESQ